MRRTKTAVRIGVCAAFLTVAALPAISTVKQDRVTVIVHRVKQLNNLDSDLPLEHDDADFYALIWIDGQQFRTKNFSEDDGRPYWTITGFTNKRRVPVRIQLMDDDGGLENKDDHVDINPWSNKKDLSFTFDTRTRRIVGDVNGRAGKFLSSQGGDEAMKGRIWFTVE